MARGHDLSEDHAEQSPHLSLSVLLCTLDTTAAIGGAVYREDRVPGYPGEGPRTLIGVCYKVWLARCAIGR